MHKNATNGYGIVTRYLHWMSAIIVIGLAGVGLLMVELPSATPEEVAAKFELYSWHKTIGVLLLFLGALRLARTIVCRRPSPLASHAAWEVTISRAIQTFFVIALVVLPLTGLLKHLTTSGGAPIWIWPIDGWLNLANSEWVPRAAGEMHQIFAFGLIVAVVLHIGGALKHHFMDRDVTLQRMVSGTVDRRTPSRPRESDVAVRRGVWIGLALSTVAIAMAAGQLKIYTSLETNAESQVLVDRPAIGRTDAVPHWIADYAKSRLTLEIQQQGQMLSARFDRFKTQIKLDPNDPSTGNIRVDVDVSSFNSGSADRDKSAQDNDWFAARKYATARFESSSVSRMSEDRYRAVGKLTLKGIERSLAIDFTLRINGETAISDGEAIVNRSEFQVGVGDWESDTMIGHKVTVRFQVLAKRQR